MKETSLRKSIDFSFVHWIYIRYNRGNMYEIRVGERGGRQLETDQ